MIENLQKDEIQKVAQIYIEGLNRQIPPSDSPLEVVKNRLANEMDTLLYKEDENILGLVSYNILESQIKINFVYAREMRKGIGTKLVNALIDLAVKENKESILSSVSIIDNRALKFYENLGFKKYGEKVYDDGFVVDLIELFV